MQLGSRLDDWKLKDMQKCSQWEEGFDFPEDLQKHIAECHPKCSPSKDRAALQCCYCHKLFVEEISLLGHVEQKHSGEKKNACSLCSESLLTMEELYRQQLVDSHQQHKSCIHSDSPSHVTLGYTSVSSTTSDFNRSVDSSTTVEATPPLPKSHGLKWATLQAANVAGASGSLANVTYICIY